MPAASRWFVGRLADRSGRLNQGLGSYAGVSAQESGVTSIIPAPERLRIGDPAKLGGLVR